MSSWLITGGAGFIGSNFARRLAAAPPAELVVLDTGHSPQVSDPQGFADRLVPFADAAFGRVAEGSTA